MTDIRRRLSGSTGGALLLHGMVMLGSGFASGVLALSFRIVLARMLPPADVGLLFSLFAVVDIALVIQGGLQLGLARAVSALPAYDLGAARRLWARLLRPSAQLALILFVGLTLASPLVARMLHLQEPLYFVVVALSVVPVLLLAVNVAVLHGLQRFIAFGVITLVIPGTRLLAALVGLALDMDLRGALVAYIAGTVAALAYSTSLLLRLPRGAGGEAAWRGGVRDIVRLSGSGMAVTVGLAGLSSGDLVAARTFLSGEAAGIYATVATLAAVVTIAVSSVSIALFPKTARAHAEGRPTRRLLLTAVAYCLLLGLGVAGAAWLLRGQVLTLLFGLSYRAGAGFLGTYMLAAAAAALAALLAQYALSVRHAFAGLLVIAAALVQFGLAAVHHAGPAALAANRLAVSVGLVAVLALMLLLESPGARRAAAAEERYSRVER